MCLSYNEYKQVIVAVQKTLNFMPFLLSDKYSMEFSTFYFQYISTSGNSDKDNINLCEYGKAVGKHLANRLYLVI